MSVAGLADGLVGLVGSSALSGKGGKSDSPPTSRSPSWEASKRCRAAVCKELGHSRWS